MYANKPDIEILALGIASSDHAVIPFRSGLLRNPYTHRLSIAYRVRRNANDLIARMQITEDLRVPICGLPGLDIDPFCFIVPHSNDKGVLLVACDGRRRHEQCWHMPT